jgi:hypothetical protein
VMNGRGCMAGVADCTRMMGGNAVTCSCGPAAAGAGGAADVWTCQ